MIERLKVPALALVALVALGGCHARQTTAVLTLAGEVPHDARGEPVLAAIRPVPVLATDPAPPPSKPAVSRESRRSPSPLYRADPGRMP